jgi:hypothetical protein
MNESIEEQKNTQESKNAQFNQNISAKINLAKGYYNAKNLEEIRILDIEANYMIQNKAESFEESKIRGVEEAVRKILNWIPLFAIRGLNEGKIQEITELFKGVVELEGVSVLTISLLEQAIQNLTPKTPDKKSREF